MTSDQAAATDLSSPGNDEPFDDSTLTEIAHLICGDEQVLLYRTGWQLPQFFQRAGWTDVPEHDGTPRLTWTRQLLQERQHDSLEDVSKAVLRLADRREYHGQDDQFKATVSRLNAVLALDGRHVNHVKGHPVLVLHDPDDEALPVKVELKVAVADVVTDPELAALVQQRLDEAHICHEHGAYTAAVIMLGSLLEGVLIHAAQSRPVTRPLPRPLDALGLQALVDLAHDHGWIEHDARLASNLVRSYRNLVHPLAQKKTGHSPDRDTLEMCWAVVNATMNDLAATTGTPPRTTTQTPAEGRERRAPTRASVAPKPGSLRRPR